MNIEQLLKRLKRLPKGEYYCGDIEGLFLKVANKSEYTINIITGDRYAKIVPLLVFSNAFDKYKYGLEYYTNGKISYIGTNDLNTVKVK